MKRVRWSSRAKRDMISIDDYLAPVSIEIANEFGHSALAASRFLLDHPHAGPMIAPETHKWRIARTDYLLLYRIMPGGIEILRVHHARQNWRGD